MLGSGARLATCGTSNYNLAVHPPALLPMSCVDIISRHCAAVLSWFAAFCFGLVCHSCFLPRYLACRAGFDLGVRHVALASTACLAAVHACLHSMAPPSVQNGPAAPSATRH